MPIAAGRRRSRPPRGSTGPRWSGPTRRPVRYMRPPREAAMLPSRESQRASRARPSSTERTVHSRKLQETTAPQPQFGSRFSYCYGATARRRAAANGFAASCGASRVFRSRSTVVTLVNTFEPRFTKNVVLLICAVAVRAGVGLLREVEHAEAERACAVVGLVREVGGRDETHHHELARAARAGRVEHARRIREDLVHHRARSARSSP